MFDPQIYFDPLAQDLRVVCMFNDDITQHKSDALDTSAKLFYISFGNKSTIRFILQFAREVQLMLVEYQLCL